VGNNLLDDGHIHNMQITEKLNCRWECSVQCSCVPGIHVVRLVEGSDEEATCRHCGEVKTHKELIAEYDNKQSQKGKRQWPTYHPGYNMIPDEK